MRNKDIDNAYKEKIKKMTVQEILKELEKLGDANTKKVLMTHGAKEPFFGVKVADLKNILKKTKKNHQLALDLYKTGNSDAMYLAGLMADERTIGRMGGASLLVLSERICCSMGNRRI